MTAKHEPKAKAKAPAKAIPKTGDKFQCGKCSLQIEVTSACGCDDATKVSFKCCGEELHQVV